MHDPAVPLPVWSKIKIFLLPLVMLLNYENCHTFGLA